MNHTDLDYLIALDRRREEMAAAARSRLAREAVASLKAARRFKTVRRQPFELGVFVLMIARGLSYLGDRMLNWSCKLQVRYEMLSGVEAQPSPCR